MPKTKQRKSKSRNFKYYAYVVILFLTIFWIVAVSYIVYLPDDVPNEAIWEYEWKCVNWDEEGCYDPKECLKLEDPNLSKICYDSSIQCVEDTCTEQFYFRTRSFR